MQIPPDPSSSAVPAMPVQRVTLPWLEQAGIELAVLRADLIDPLVSGNKYFKLKYNLQSAREQGLERLLSFGGPWSNHLHALAAAGQRHGFATIGVVRGEAPPVLNDCLRDSAAMGMKLHFISRADYARKEDADFIDRLRNAHGDFLLIPEGGANLDGIRGCRELAAAIVPEACTHILLACGTGTTLMGLVSATATPVIGIQVLKGQGYLRDLVASRLREHGLAPKAQWQMLDEFHGGGYAKADRELLDFIATFTAATGIPLEPVYSGKLLFAIARLAEQHFFPRGSRLLAIHGGGLQGTRGWRPLADRVLTRR